MSNLDKKRLRLTLKNLRDDLSDKARRSTLVSERLIASELYREAEVVIPYFHIRSEVSTSEIVTRAFLDDKLVYAPFVSGSDLQSCRLRSLDELEPGYQGILEPKLQIRTEVLEIDACVKPAIILVPGLGFTTRGDRIGYGKGFYDSLLAKRNKPVVAIGIAFDCQIVENLPTEDHDQTVDVVITETSLYTPYREVLCKERKNL